MRNRLPILETKKPRRWQLSERNHAKFCHKQLVVPRVSVHPRILRNNHNNKYRQWRPCYRRPHRLTQSASRPSHGRIWFGGNPPGQPGRRMESVIRSIEQGRVEVHRKLPKSESLKQCMDRTIPFFTERIVPEALNQGKRVLISSSENAIRGLLMHLCDIPPDKITKLEIPNGLPIVFDLKSKCVKLLDDGTGRDSLEVYNFGKAANYLFRPCEKEDGSPDEECDVTFIGENFQLSKEDQATIDAIKRPKTSPEPIIALRAEN